MANRYINRDGNSIYAHKMDGFIGYWRKSKQPFSSHYFSQLVISAPHYGCLIDEESGKQAELLGWGSGFTLDKKERALCAGLSASGIMDELCVSVEIDCQRLRLWREPFGRIQLFWLDTAEAIWFATRLQLLIPLLTDYKLSPWAFYGYNCFSYLPQPLTPLQNVCSLQAGSAITWQPTKREQQLWQWQEATELLMDEEAAIEQLRKLLEEAIVAQLTDIKDQPVGVFLSGGLDSSIVAALLVRAGVKVSAYTLDFGAYGISEWSYAEQVATALNIPLRKVVITPRQVAKLLRDTAGALDMPYGDGVTIPFYLLAATASRDVSVIFNGEGGDQLFAGWTNKPLIAAGVYQQYTPQITAFEQQYLKTFHRLHGYERGIFTPELYGEISEWDVLQWLRDAVSPQYTPSLLHRLRRANLMLKGAQNIQPRATALCFAHQLKVRTPFCYLPLAEWTFSLAPALLLRASCEKFLLKRAVSAWLPQAVVWREKRGMGVPLTQWLLSPLWRKLGEWLHPDLLNREGYWQHDLPLRIALGKLSGQIQGRRIGESLWLMVMWQAWRAAVLPEDPPTAFYNPFWLPPKWWRWRMQTEEI